MRYSISDFGIDLAKDFFLIAGPCVIESREHVFFMASELKKITSGHGVAFVLKALRSNRSGGPARTKASVCCRKCARS
jgi:2-dehydro-3-deoxyphosphooctonate aldolase (KDO 8-P synthase)